MIALHTIGRYAPTSTGPPPAWLAERLTRRQCEVALLVADGYCDKEIAQQLGLASSTIPRYVKRIAARLKCNEFRNSRIQITRLVVLAWADEEAA